MNKALVVALVALAFTPVLKDFDENPGARPGRTELSRETPAPVKMAQRCFNYGGRVRCF